jgi:hypothetical protein
MTHRPVNSSKPVTRLCPKKSSMKLTVNNSVYGTLYCRLDITCPKYLSTYCTNKSIRIRKFFQNISRLLHFNIIAQLKPVVTSPCSRILYRDRKLFLIHEMDRGALLGAKSGYGPKLVERA